MRKDSHLWAIGFDNMERAEQFRTEIQRLGDSHCLILLDTSVAIRYPDGTVTLDGEHVVGAIKGGSFSLAGFLAALALGAPPLTGAAVGVWMKLAGEGVSGAVIDDDFMREVEALMKPASSALFVLDQAGDMGPILAGIRGLGGTVLKTNVDLDRAKLIQSTLAAANESR